MIPQAGDFILYRVSANSGWLGKLISWGQIMIKQAPTKRSYEHVAIVGPKPDRMYEAIWPRIRNTALRLDNAEVYRIKGLTQEQVAHMLIYLDQHLGDWYDILAILSFGLLQLGKTEVCSQLAYNAALAVGVVVYPPEALESPDDIAGSDKLEKIG